MPAPAVKLNDLSADARRGAVAGAVERLSAGEVVILPTDTVYSAAVIAGSPAAAEVGRVLRAGGSMLAWNPGSGGEAGVRIAFKSAVHRRLFGRLSPGPVIFTMEPGTAEGGPWPATGGEGAEGWVRRTGHGTAREVVEGVVGAEVLLGEIPVGGGGRGGWATEAGEAREGARLAAALGEVWTLDEGTLRPGRPATVIRFGPAGAWSIDRPGAYEERFVRKQLRRTILFVCTGNTCRSPMAEAIAADVLAKSDDGLATTVMSAGTGAAGGAPPTPEALEALRELGISPRLRGSKGLTRQMIAEADVIFAMSRSHLHAVLSFDPSASGKAKLLDPEGGDVPDPIGYPQEVYSHTAQRLREMIEARLKELDA